MVKIEARSFSYTGLCQCQIANRFYHFPFLHDYDFVTECIGKGKIMTDKR